MSEIQSPDLTWSADVKLNGTALTDIRYLLERVLNEASKAALLGSEEASRFVIWVIATMAGAETANIKQHLGEPGIELSISFARNPWSKVWLTGGRTKRYTVHIVASAKPQLPQS
ncbi:hypothetical protein [Actinoallomurus sp. NPDC050550]|uniref:hypothetical protein n=1 Tax=Actinoallomurus sp. NPDC050550 TaxID=3154937 RepID=UPI00340E0E00